MCQSLYLSISQPEDPGSESGVSREKLNAGRGVYDKVFQTPVTGACMRPVLINPKLPGTEISGWICTAMPPSCVSHRRHAVQPHLLDIS